MLSQNNTASTCPLAWLLHVGGVTSWVWFRGSGTGVMGTPGPRRDLGHRNTALSTHQQPLECAGIPGWSEDVIHAWSGLHEASPSLSSWSPRPVLTTEWCFQRTWTLSLTLVS